MTSYLAWQNTVAFLLQHPHKGACAAIATPHGTFTVTFTPATATLKGRDMSETAAPTTQMTDRREPRPETETEPLLQFFSYDHLSPSLADVSRPFCSLAHHIVESMRRNPERTVCLRKLLEAKDCAVRSFLSKYRPIHPRP